MGLFRGCPFSFKMQWEARFQKTGDRIGKLGRRLFCLPKGGLFKQNRNRMVRAEEESKTSLALSLLLCWGQRVKGAYPVWG